MFSYLVSMLFEKCPESVKACPWNGMKLKLINLRKIFLMTSNFVFLNCHWTRYDFLKYDWSL